MLPAYDLVTIFAKLCRLPHATDVSLTLSIVSETCSSLGGMTIGCTVLLMHQVWVARLELGAWGARCGTLGALGWRAAVCLSCSVNSGRAIALVIAHVQTWLLWPHLAVHLFKRATAPLLHLLRAAGSHPPLWWAVEVMLGVCQGCTMSHMQCSISIGCVCGVGVSHGLPLCDVR